MSSKAERHSLSAVTLTYQSWCNRSGWVQVTEWANGMGVNVEIHRSPEPDQNLSLTWEDMQALIAALASIQVTPAKEPKRE